MEGEGEHPVRQVEGLLDAVAVVDVDVDVQHARVDLRAAARREARWEVRWRGRGDAWAQTAWVRRCDGKGPRVFILRAWAHLEQLEDGKYDVVGVAEAARLERGTAPGEAEASPTDGSAGMATERPEHAAEAEGGWRAVEGGAGRRSTIDHSAHLAAFGVMEAARPVDDDV